MSDSGDGVTHDCSRAVGEVSSGIYGGEDGVICEGEQFASDCGGGEVVMASRVSWRGGRVWVVE